MVYGRSQSLLYSAVFVVKLFNRKNLSKRERKPQTVFQIRTEALVLSGDNVMSFINFWPGKSKAFRQNIKTHGATGGDLKAFRKV